MTTILPILLAIADFGHPITFSTNCQDGRTIAVQVAVNGCQITPLKSEFREWIDPRVTFIVETGELCETGREWTKDDPVSAYSSCLILDLYNAKLRQIALKFKRAAEEEREER